MEKLMKVLEELFGSTDVELEDDHDGFLYFKDGEIADRARSLCCEYLITEKGGCNWENIDTLRQNGYSVFAGERDSFGWLTGCVRKKGGNKVLVYG